MDLEDGKKGRWSCRPERSSMKSLEKAVADYEKAKTLLMSHDSGRTMFSGLALAENSEKLAEAGADSERPTLQQLSIGLLRYAEENR